MTKDGEAPSAPRVASPASTLVSPGERPAAVITLGNSGTQWSVSKWIPARPCRVIQRSAELTPARKLQTIASSVYRSDSVRQRSLIAFCLGRSLRRAISSAA